MEINHTLLTSDNEWANQMGAHVVKSEDGNKFGLVIAVIPVNGRLPLVKHTIERLLNKNGVGKVICIVSNRADIETCEKAGAKVIRYRNDPLGAKWNAGFIEACKYNPSACLFVGSSDWLSDNWLPTLMPLIGEYDMVGTPGCSFLDISKGQIKAMEWPGYTGQRASESIGIGRLISARILNKIGWKPFDGAKDGSMDYYMDKRVRGKGGKVILYRGKEVTSLSISTDKWINKHKFSDHESGKLPSNTIENVDEFIRIKFPEALNIFP